MGKNTYDLKDYVKAKFPTVDYVDLVFPGPAPGGPEEHHQDSLGASHRRPNRLDWHPRRLPPHTLGATVTEVDLDAEDGDSDEEDKQDGNALFDDEAEEEEKEE